MTLRWLVIGGLASAALAGGCRSADTEHTGPGMDSGSSTSAPTRPTTIERPAPSASETFPPPTGAATDPPSSSTTDPEPAPPADLSSAAGIGAELARVELAIRSVAADDPDAPQLGREQQLAYRALADHPEWDAEVVAGAPESVRAPIELNIEARRAVVAHAATRAPRPPSPTLPAWSIVPPLAVTELLELYRAAEAASGVPWAYLAAINFVETRFGRIAGASADGALGPMQFLPSTWAECCTGDITDPRDAVFGAAAYLASNGAPGDLLGALYAYNPNDGYVGAVDAYARNLLADERALTGYHGWEVYVSSSAGTVRLPIGYAATEPVDAATYLAQHPQDRAG